MTTEEKTLLTMLTVAAVLVPVALGAVLGWPAWSWLLLAVPLLGILGLVIRSIQRRVQYELLSQPSVAPPGQVERQDPAWQTPVGDMELPSAVAGYAFRFSATAYWRPVRGSRMQHANLGALARDVIVVRAQTITAAEQPNNVEIVQHRLASELGTVRRDTTGVVEAWADHVQLTLSEADQQRLHRFLEVCKNKDLWEHERNYECRKRDYLSKDVLKSTGSAVIWWLAQKDNDVEDTVRLIGSLAQLSAAANDREVPELFRHLVPTPAALGQLPFESLNGNHRFPNGSFPEGGSQTTSVSWTGLPAGQFSDARPVTSRWGTLMDMLDVSDDAQRALLTRYFAELIEKFGKPDEAQEIRRHLDAPATDKEPAEVPKPDDDLPDSSAPDVVPPGQEEPWQNSPLSRESEQDGQSQAHE